MIYYRYQLLRKNITASFGQIDSQLDGVGNLAFNIWITDSQTPISDNVTREIMIWTKNFGQMPDGNKISDITIDNNKFELYKGDWDWTYFAFVNKSSDDIKEISIDKFVKYLLENNLITSDEFISSIEFGNEIIEGSGKTIIKNYKININ